MKTDIKGVLNQVEKSIESLKADTNDAEWSPQLGTAIGGLRAAKDGLEAHLDVVAQKALSAATPLTKPIL